MEEALSSPKFKILVVDDERSMTLLLQKLLEQEDYQTDAANSAAHALMLVRKQKYHIALIDIMMPDMDGLDLLKELRGIDPMIQTVMMTAGVTMSKTMAALELGAVDFILKPFNKEEVLLVTRLCVAKLKRWQGVILATYHQRQQQNKTPQLGGDE